MTVSDDCNYILMVLNRQLYYNHLNCVCFPLICDLLTMTMVGRLDFFVEMLFVDPRLPHWECRNRGDWSAVYCTHRKSRIAEHHNDRMVGNGIGNAEHCEGTQPLVYGSIRDEKEIQRTVGFALVVYMEWNVTHVLVVMNDSLDTMESHIELVMLLLVRLLNGEHEVRYFLRQKMTVYRRRLVQLAVFDVNMWSVEYMVT